VQAAKRCPKLRIPDKAMSLELLEHLENPSTTLSEIDYWTSVVEAMHHQKPFLTAIV